jgi:Ca2+-binding RTX toxin-like protein
VNCSLGNDYVNNYASSLRLEAFGQGGNDTLIGDAQNDHLHGGEGNDVLYGYGGNDFLEGRKDYDRLFGMSGNDTLDGGDDGVADYLNGGTGFDRFQQDTYFFLGFIRRNRDYPVDFVSGVDSFYQA